VAWQYSVLVVANVTGTSPELIDALRERAGRDTCSFTVLIPAPGGGSAGRDAARTRLAEVLEALQAEGLEVQGEVGDPDPIAAVHDLWDPQKFDEVVVSTLPTGSSRWLAIDLPHRLEKLTGVQVTHVVARPPEREARTEPPPPKPERYGLLTPFAAIAGRRRRRTAPRA
jgi:hypothetical protein